MTDPSKYTAIAHRDLDILNPIPADKLDAAVSVLALTHTSRALDLGCGKGDLVKRISRKFGCEVVGIDRSPTLVAAAEDPRVILGDAKEGWRDGRHWDAVACVGASHIFGDLAGALEAIVPHLARGGRVLFGEGFWKKEPDAEYLEAIGGTRDEMPLFHELVAMFSAHGLVPIDVTVASEDDFDRYEWAHARGVERFAAENPLDPDAKPFLERSRAWRASYVRWGRQTLGFALVTAVVAQALA